MRDEALATKVQGVVQMCGKEEGGGESMQGDTENHYRDQRESKPFKANERKTGNTIREERRCAWEPKTMLNRPKEGEAET